MGFQKAIPDDSPRSLTPKGTGDWGEAVAYRHFASMGYAMRETKWKGNGYEIDLIVQKGTRVVFVEVKTRSGDTTDPAEAVDMKKRQRMIAAADIYLKNLGLPLDYQFDIIAITGTERDFRLEHVPDAFFPSPRTRH